MMPAPAKRRAGRAEPPAQGASVRRFERGVSTDLTYLRNWLAARGYEVTYVQRGSRYAVKGTRCPAKTLDRAEFFAFIDELRVAEGLEPFVSAGAP